MKIPPRRSRRRKATPKSGEWPLMLIDGAPIRRKARRDYDKVIRDLENAKGEVERFQSEDKPKYEKWIHANFGALLTEIRELQEKLFHTQGLVNEVQQEFYYGNYRSIASAYKKVMKRRANPEEYEEEEKAQQEQAEEFEAAFEEMFGKVGEEFWARLGVDPEELAREEQQLREQPGGTRAKDLYRRLVRRLHPDKGQKRSPREIEWWHQTQQAYQDGNVEQLELILTLVEMEEEGSAEATVSILSQLTAEFKKSLRALKRKITQFRRDVAWNFSKVTEFSLISEKTCAQLTAEKEEMSWLLAKYEQQLRSWEQSAAAPARRKPRARKAALQDDELF